MMMWRTDKELIEESLKKAFSVRDQASDDRFDHLIKQLRAQDERLRNSRKKVSERA